MQLQIAEHSVSFFVCPDGVDAGMLEFILQDAEKRNDKLPGFYEQTLWGMMNDALEDAGRSAQGVEWARVKEMCSYGSLSFSLVYAESEHRDQALKVCTAAAKRWASKYGIRRMKETAPA